MAKSRKSNRRDFLDQFDPSDTFLQKPNRKTGAPGIIEGSSSNGDPLLIRCWPRDGKADNDLVEIWRNELRLLHRLGGAPGADEYIARLLDAGEDGRGFYIVIAAGQRRPLAALLASGNAGTKWLKFTSSPMNRRRFWANFRRIAAGLEILHSQSLVHCNLDAWSILSTGDTEPDFQLTGFEWSMRLMGSTERTHTGNRTYERAISFLDDWRDFATLAATVLNVSAARLQDLKIPHYDVADSLSADEVWLLRELLSPSPNTYVDGEYVTRRIDVILEALEGAAAAEEPQYQVVLNVGRESGLSRAIREASDLAIDIEDASAQIEFIMADLTKPRVIAIGRNDDVSIALRGVDLVYRLRPYTIPRTDGPSWEFAVCEKAELGKNFNAPILSNDLLPTNSLRFMTFSEANQRAPRVRGRVLSWDGVRARLSSAAPTPDTREQRALHALTLLHAVELVVTAAEVFPVKARVSHIDPNRIEINLEPDDDRQKVSEALGLQTMDRRLEQLLEREIADEEGWRLAEARTLGRRNVGDIELHFESAEVTDQTTKFIFRTETGSVGPPAAGILIPGEFRGRISQFRRRANALRALASHKELLQMLGDPRGRLSASHEPPPQEAHLSRLDEAKQSAFEELTAVLPLYLVQGPPGVGKTFLVREVVQRRFSEEATSRLLLAAQSHHTVDHLMAEIRKDWEDASITPLAVRCRATDEVDTSNDYDLRNRTDSILKDFASSGLAKSCSGPLAERLNSLKTSTGSAEQKAPRSDRRLLEGLVMRAANVVFATTNSGDLERLLDERGQFDWSIVEEAGKATGVELLLPLLLSYRRLMIGDHKQLPPFGSEKMDKLLSTPNDLRSAMKLGLELVERSLRDVIPDDIQEMLESEDREDAFAVLCGEARRMLFLFQTLVEAEVDRQRTPGVRGRPIARRLNIQHRMHPQISDLVSKCFYDDALKTSKNAAGDFTNGACPVRSLHPQIIADVPIVVIDMPYERSTKGLRDVERYPRYTNDQEVDASKALITALRGDGITEQKASLAVISPYARQVNRLRGELLEDGAVNAALSTFQPVARNGAWCSTIDAFQGNEADAVVISLVRNNHHATVRKALGFVSDYRRMNVLLSRAKWRLYIVTSLEFLRTVTAPLGQESSTEGAFLRQFLSTMDEYEAAGVASYLPYHTLLKCVK